MRIKKMMGGEGEYIMRIGYKNDWGERGICYEDKNNGGGRGKCYKDRK